MKRFGLAILVTLITFGMGLAVSRRKACDWRCAAIKWEYALGTKPIVNKDTGEVIDEIIPETHTMDTEEFNQYLERAANFMASFCEIAVMPAESFYEPDSRRK